MSKKWAWTDSLVVVAIVGAGVVVAGVTNDPVEASSSYASEPVEYPVDIPGCDTVEPPEDSVSYGFARSGLEGYDHPDYPWLTSTKANAMSLAIQEALPDDIEVVAGSRALFYSDPFVFQPVPFVSPEFDAGTTAEASVIRDGTAGSLTVNVTRSDDGPRPCQAGWLDSRETVSDGTVVDVQDTWSEYSGERIYTNVARIYATDGTRITASASDRDDEFRSTGTVPMSIDELRSLAAIPELLWSTPVPGDVLPVPLPCATTGLESGQFTDEIVQNINAALDGFWRSIDAPVALDRPLGALRVSPEGTSSACGSVLAGGDALTISVSDADYQEPEGPALTLSDGAQFRDDQPGTASASLDGKPIENVLLVKPSGTRIDVEFASNTKSLDRAMLQGIALAVASAVI
ncbi:MULTISPECIES: hypothetical protein [Rhodococcus]|uniref:Uncharacterized protein n=1 Tax=Rhodococcoides kyotonense TaxID=398843 RepID=A0A177YHM2_9NOCA|nr:MULTISPECIES: hypothetical protein [Rhodococcus]NIL74798.1 hypothetical protein [Rhodococcus sp. B10]OAK54800.1 hypothetical protein A3K89_05625 [Rhodococcus kyotonensis]